ncbi:MAG: hypothetical protein EB127_05240 [Alphaproteobacteria bacterium]|nr:hypothetical protein [Alphaproteobacteria bacterium]
MHFIEKDQFFLFGLGAFIIPESLLKKNTKVNIVIETPIHKVFNNYGSSNVTTSNKITLKAKELDGLFIMAKNDLMISNDPKHNLSSVSIGLEPEVFNPKFPSYVGRVVFC